MLRGLTVLAISVVVAGCGGGDDDGGGGVLGGLFKQPGPHVSAQEQKALPTAAYFLVDALCARGIYGPDSPPRELRRYERWRRRAVREYRALRRALQEHPDAVVSAQFSLSDPEPGEERTQTEEVTVLELAKTFLTGGVPPDSPLNTDCTRRFRAELGALIDEVE